MKVEGGRKLASRSLVAKSNMAARGAALTRGVERGIDTAGRGKVKVKVKVKV